MKRVCLQPTEYVKKISCLYMEISPTEDGVKQKLVLLCLVQIRDELCVLDLHDIWVFHSEQQHRPPKRKNVKSNN